MFIGIRLIQKLFLVKKKGVNGKLIFDPFIISK